MYEPKLIAPYKSGLIQYWKPWLIGDDAFEMLQDAYSYRGSIRKREGSRLLTTTSPSIPAPVQCLPTFILPNSLDEQLLALNQTQAFLFNTAGSVFNNISLYSDASPVLWTGGIDDYFWWTNFAGALWITNNVDIMRFWNGSAGTGWSNQLFPIDATNFVFKTKLVIGYKGRLLLLNTSEGTNAPGTRFAQRARWCQLGTPFVTDTDGAPAIALPPGQTSDNNAWRTDIPGKGGFLDADTSESIVSCAIINDVLIVFFERSTWRLRFTGSQIQPFIFERISVEFGSESPRSTVIFENAAYTWSRNGYISADTNTVRRIDQQVIDQAQDIYTGPGVSLGVRVNAIRDLNKQFFYWAYQADNQATAVTPTNILAYNYLEDNWAITTQAFKCFGRYKAFSDVRWQDLTVSWESTNVAWNNAINVQGDPLIVAGNKDGDVVVVFEDDSNDDWSFASQGQVNFNFDVRTARFNPYIAQGQRARLAYVDIYCTAIDAGQISLDLFINDNTDNPVATKLVNMGNSALATSSAYYTRVFLGVTAYMHQIRLYLSPAQLANTVTGKAKVEIQGILAWTAPAGRIKNL